MRGLFITFEGPDGSGKTTQIQLLAKHIKDLGYEAVLTREPGGTPIGEKIRALILDKNNQEMDDVTEALLYAAARAQHVKEVIRPNLEAGKIVLCDRFVDSSIAYQAYGRKLGECVSVINDIAVNSCIPDATFFLSLDPKVGKERIQDEDLDRLELEKLEYHNAVYQGYITLVKLYPERIISINADREVDSIREEICLKFNELLEKQK